MKEILIKRLFKNFLLFFIYFLIIELIVKINVQSNLFNWGTFRIIISSIILSLIIALIISFNKRLWRNIAASIIAFFAMLYAWVEMNLYNYLGFFMGIGNAEQGAKVTDYVVDMIKASKMITYFVIIPFGLLMLYYWYLDIKLKEKKLIRTTVFKFEVEKLSKKILTYTAACFSLIILSICYYFTLTNPKMQSNLQSIKNTNLFIYPDNSNLAVSQFGVMTYVFTDMFSQLFNVEIDEDFISPNLGYNDKVQTNPDYTRKIDDKIWQTIIDNEKNTTMNKINNYLINREITSKNEHTGLFEDKNLIVILMESIGEVPIYYPEYFPTLYKLYNESISFRNNYSPKNSCSTGNNEMTVMTSLYSINNTCTANTYKKNQYFEAMFNMFNKAGYETSSYHNYADFYYDRKTIHANMGSSVYRNASALGIPWSSEYITWPSDIDLINKSTPYFINQDRFMVFLTTVSAHQPYTVASNMGNKNLALFKDTDYPLAIKRYLSKIKELDLALEELLRVLEGAGKLEDTVIALFADHEPYGLNNKYKNMLLPYDVNQNMEVDRTPMMIYNASTTKEEVYKYTSIVSLLPTLLNLFDIDYDPRLYLGQDIFSEHDDRVIFADGSWQDSVGYYSATSGKFTPTNDNDITYTKEEIITINDYVNGLQKISSLAIRNNYFYYLNNAFNKYKIEE